ncbi:MAG: DUF3006 domain-containing protein [Acutalibacteraceae bacterium]
MEKLIVERIEDGLAVLEKEDLSHETVELSLLPTEVKEGSVLTFDGAEYRLDEREEEDRRRRILEKQKRLKEKSKKP